MSLSKIKLLSESVSNQIAAGEVVTEPASVVKEMVENAVDAGAKNITVSFRDAGRELIQIIDDGEGMSPADARMAFEKHATSKINSVDDIYALHTFGFRGEALASIAAVACVELSTRREDDELGTKIIIEGGRFVSQESTVCPKGSRFMVKNIFFNLPARRRMLESRQVGIRHLTTEFQRVALCYPQVSFMLFNQDSQVYNLPASNLKQRIVGVMGKQMSASLLEVETRTSIVSIDGYIGIPSAAKRTGTEQYLFINGRYFKSTYYTKAIMQAYEKLIPSGLRPSFFLYLTVNPEDVDVNIHPQKTEVKFSDGVAVWQIINAAVRETLAKSGSVPMMDFEAVGQNDIPVAPQRSNAGWLREPASAGDPYYNPFERKPVGRASKADLSDFSQPYFSNVEAQPTTQMPFDRSLLDFIETGQEDQQLDLEIERDRFKGVLPLIGGYVATTLNGQLTVVDLRRARQLLLFKRYSALLDSGNSISQPLLFSQRMVLSSDDMSLMELNSEQFTTIGFDFHKADDNAVMITAVPADMPLTMLNDVLYDLIDGIRSQTADGGTVRRNYLAEVLSKAVGTARLTIEEVEAALDSLDGCKDGRFTSDGKAVMWTMDNDQIRERFR